MTPRSNIRSLSKSTFLRGMQCPKSLWLNAHRPDLRDGIGEELQAVFRRGHDVGTLARGIFPGGVDAAGGGHGWIAEALARTKELVDSGAPAIYEAAFSSGGALCFIDILARGPDGWRAFEVKSSTSVTDVYLLDASVQYWIITGAGLPLADISIVHLDNGYVRHGEIDLSRLFAVRSVRDEAEANLAFIEENVKRLRKVLGRRTVPDIGIGGQCFSPYECDFLGHCWKDVPEYSVFDIAGIKKKDAFGLYERGIVTFDDIPDDEPLSAAQRLQVERHRDGRAHVDVAGIREFLAGAPYPLHFMDFETFMPAVPLFDESRPYQQIPFQYSVHFKASRAEAPRHREFLADAGPDPRPAFIECLLEDTREPGDIVVYSSFEETRLKELARDFPAFAADIEERIARLVDLAAPFRTRLYYHPSQRGSWSIKAVLPALVSGAGYEGLAIADGGAAMAAYESLFGETDAGKIARMRADLLAYCAMDTLAMVRVMERLAEIAG